MPKFIARCWKIQQLCQNTPEGCWPLHVQQENDRTVCTVFCSITRLSISFLSVLDRFLHQWAYAQTCTFQTCTNAHMPRLGSVAITLQTCTSFAPMPKLGSVPINVEAFPDLHQLRPAPCFQTCTNPKILRLAPIQINQDWPHSDLHQNSSEDACLTNLQNPLSLKHEAIADCRVKPGKQFLCSVSISTPQFHLLGETLLGKSHEGVHNQACSFSSFW